MILRLVVKLLGVVRAMLLAAGLGALAATAAGWIMVLVNQGSGGANSPLRMFALQIAAVFLVAAVGSSALLPRATDLTAPAPNARQTPSAIVISLLLLGLAVWAVVQAPFVGSWWIVDRALLVEATGTGRDPMGLRIIPTVILLSLPTLAAVALATCLLTSVAGILARADHKFRVVAASVLVLAGLVIGEQVILRALRGLGTTVQTAIDPSSDPTATAQVSGWLERHDVPAGDASRRLIWLLAGYGVVVAIAGMGAAAQRD